MDRILSETNRQIEYFALKKMGEQNEHFFTFKNPARIAKYVAALNATVTGTARLVKASPIVSSSNSNSFLLSYTI